MNSVPNYPIEDEKLRATALTRRRGGNCGNSLEVLSQLNNNNHTVEPANTTMLHLLTALPNRNSVATQFIHASLPANVDMTSCIYRANFEEAASSYILQNAENQSRTIVSWSPFHEMEVNEFVQSVEGLVWKSHVENGDVWCHFEGRVPETVLGCVKWLRERQQGRKSRIRVSVECENPKRGGMGKVAEGADVVFFSRIWVLVSTFFRCGRDGSVWRLTFVCL